MLTGLKSVLKITVNIKCGFLSIRSSFSFLSSKSLQRWKILYCAVSLHIYYVLKVLRYIWITVYTRTEHLDLLLIIQDAKQSHFLLKFHNSANYDIQVRANALLDCSTNLLTFNEGHLPGSSKADQKSNLCFPSI